MSRIVEFLTLIIGVIPVLVTSIQISSNGNSPEIKMVGGMMVDVQKRNVHDTTILKETPIQRDPGGSKTPSLSSTKLAINERYRRLIPYMTFYYANDLTSSTTERYAKSVEIEKAEIVEAPTLVEQLNQRQPKRIVYNVFRDIPRYQGNRLTQYNIASANPVRHYQDTLYQNSINVTPNYNPFVSGYIPVTNYDSGRNVQKQTANTVPFAFSTRKPQFNYYNEELSDLHYLTEKDVPPKYKLVPYQQTPPVKVPQLSGNVYNKPRKPIPVPVLIPTEQIYVPRTTLRPQYLYDNQEQQITPRKPTTISENYYEKQRPKPFFVQPVVEGGFKPMMPTTEVPQYLTSTSLSRYSQYENERPQAVQVLEDDNANSETDEFRPKYYQYNVNQPTYYYNANQPTYDYKPQYIPSTHKMTLGDLIKTLQKNKSLPDPITKENIASSIRTLLQALNALKAKPIQNEVEIAIMSTPKPFDVPKEMIEADVKPVIIPTTAPIAVDTDKEPYLSPINPPSQHLDDYPSEFEISQKFPLPITSDDDGGTPGQPGVDYPVLETIPHTSFDCKTQRYKGFFADTETRCQVWHYCDLNGGQASFLCPNGTIFSQAALTCDWWYNVRCSSTTQLYVLNESLYKFILPHTPMFPEDYSGPLVDKYLTLKFKEMEEEFKKKKNKSASSNKDDSKESEESTEVSSSADSSSEASTIDGGKSDVTEVNVANVMIGSPGESGNVERLHS